MRHMGKRCPNATFVGTGMLKHSFLCFRGDTDHVFATIAPKAGAFVPVGLWKISPEDEEALNVSVKEFYADMTQTPKCAYTAARFLQIYLRRKRKSLMKAVNLQGCLLLF